MVSVDLDVKDLATSYGSFSIKGVSFSLRGGDILALVGRSGSGKSTVIKSIVGLKKADSGLLNVLLNGEEKKISDVVGYSPQENALFPFLTVEENIVTFGKLHNVNGKEIKKRMNFLLRRLDLQKSKKKKVKELSGGMQKRADLAVALIHSPKIVILDEPFAGLDISLQRFIWGLLKEIAQEGRIIIISSHMLQDIQRNCNKFGLIENGRYYNTEQIVRTIQTNKEKSFESFLERLFTRDLRDE